MSDGQDVAEDGGSSDGDRDNESGRRTENEEKGCDEED